MKKNQIMSVLLTITIAIGFSGCTTSGASAPTTVSVTLPTTATTVPVTTVPTTTVPVTTVPVTTVPTTTVLETTVPSTTVVPTTTPKATTQPKTATTEKESSENDEETLITQEEKNLDFDEYFPPATTTTAPTTEEKVEYSSSEYGIFIDISTQELRYYEAGELILYSPVVTGDAYNSPTPMGNFWVNNKAQNTILYGDDYESHVEYWIAFLGSGYGFHDASWRDSFGGDIYLYDGSHGCINMPLSAVAELYSLVEIGTPVFIE